MTSFFKDMVSVNTKMLNLWNGTNNDLPPSGFEATGFDDSGWSNPATPSSAALKYAFRVVPASIYTNTLPVGGPTPCWPTSSPQSNYQYALARWHFDLPATYTLNDVLFWTPSDVDGGRFGNLDAGTAMWLNGSILPTSLDQPFGATQTQINTQFHARAVTGDNVFAFEFKSGGYNDPLLPLWGSNAWFTARIDIDVVGGGRSFGIVIG